MNPAIRSNASSAIWASFGELSIAEQALIDAACDNFEAHWQTNSAPDLATYLQDAPTINLHGPLFRELLRIEIAARRSRGEVPTEAEYASRFPQFRSILADCFSDEAAEPGVTQTWNAQRTKGRTAGVKAPAIAFPLAFGEYELLGELGRGGMGVVYRARQPKLNRFVALKLTRPDADWDERAKRYFRNEAAAVAGLDHPGIVPLYEIGEEEGQLYFTMALVNGPSLRELLREAPLPAETAAYLIKEVALAVQAAHERGVIHRDLKPHNILLEGGRRPRVVDFGLAQNAESASEQTVGLAIGSPSYMPPEQALGKTAEIGPRSDVYSLGATLYEAVTGKPPFRAATVADTLRQVLDSEPIPPRQLNSSVPRDLETILLKCLSKSPAGRYPTALALAEDLERFLQGEAVLARPITRLERGWRWCWRNRLSATLLALCLVIVVAGASAFVVQSRLAYARLATEKATADANFDTAVTFVDTHLRNSDSKATAESIALLEAAVAAYQQRVKRNPRDLKSWQVLSGTAGRAAASYRQLGRHAEAVAVARVSVAAMRKVVELTNSDQDRHTLANRLEFLDAISDSSDPGLGDEVRALREQVAAADQDVNGVAYGNFLTAFNQSLAEAHAGKIPAAIATIEKGLIAAETARRAGPDDDLSWRQIENGYAHLGELLLQQGRTADGTQILHDSIARLQKFIAAHPRCIHARQALAEGANRLVLYVDGDKLKFAQMANDARTELLRLRLQEPAYRIAVQGLRDAEYNLGEELLGQDKFAEAREVLLTAERLLVLEGPEAPQDRLAYTLNLLAQAANGQQDYRAARGYLQRAMIITRDRAAAEPANAQLEFEAVVMVFELGKAEARSGEPAAGVRHLLAAAAGFRDLAPRAKELLQGFGQPICLYYSAAVYAQAYGSVQAHESELPEELVQQKNDLRQLTITGLRNALAGGFNDTAAQHALLRGVAHIVDDEEWKALKDDPEILAIIKPVP